MDLSFSRKGTASISGFHLDLINAVEASGLVKFVNKVVDKTGCYKADLFIEGALAAQGKTFFPAHWSREDVAKAIYEAYERCMKNCVKSGKFPELRSDGKFLVEGLCDAGIEIQMWITKNGLVTTAYPKL
ncbi:MAG TPA: EndoU domain-containing protein [Candidatus Babeliales bacterium]|nr:EndoU domain-containing protein [Candidatus Babeliales bacterium]